MLYITVLVVQLSTEVTNYIPAAGVQGSVLAGSVLGVPAKLSTAYKNNKCIMEFIHYIGLVMT